MVIVYFNNWDFENKDIFYKYLYIYKLFSLEYDQSIYLNNNSITFSCC